MRFVGLSWFRGLPPHWAQLTAFWPLGIASLLTTIPSTTNSGSVPALMVETPRRLTWMPPPGAPEFDWISAPGIFPCSADSSVPVGARVSSSALTVATALGRFCRSIPVDWPVTTSSSSLNGSVSSTTSALACPSGRLTVCRLYPIPRKTRLKSPSGAFSV